nr:hypothetical protein [uncultured Oscillibacter sp.]
MDKLDLILERLGKFEEDMNSRLDAVDSRLDAVDSRLDAVDSRLDSVDSRLDSVDSRLDAVDSRLDAVDSRLDTMDSRLDGLELEITKTNLTIENEIKPQIGILAEAVQGINAKLDAMPTAEDLEITNSRIDTLEAIVKRLSRDVANLKKAQ